MAKKKAAKFVACTLRSLPAEKAADGVKTALRENPANLPPAGVAAAVAALLGTGRKVLTELRPDHLAVLVSKYWGAGGVKLGVAFLDGGPADLRARILGHMNAWGGARANVVFAEAGRGTADVRVTRTPGDGYWSYLGTDVRHIPADEPTMNLASFSMATPEAEYRRVVRHETGHTLGFPHEHLRREIIERLDPARTIAYFRQRYGWSEQMTRHNVLTPLEEASIMGTPSADQDSVMAYQLPAEITRDGRPIPGGPDINEADAAFCGQIYPLAAPPPPPEGETAEIPAAGTYRVVTDRQGRTHLVLGATA